MKFADKLRKERELLGLKQKEMALKLNLPTNTYNGYETGKRTPSLEVTAQIADTLGVSVDYLLDRSYSKNLYKDEYNQEVSEAFEEYKTLNEENKQIIMQLIKQLNIDKKK